MRKWSDRAGIENYNALQLFETTNLGLDVGVYKKANEITSTDLSEMSHSNQFEVIYPFMVNQRAKFTLNLGFNFINKQF